MRYYSIFGFILLMWGLILVGGGLLVAILGPYEFTSDRTISGIIKGIMAVSLVVMWILILEKMKTWIFTKHIEI